MNRDRYDLPLTTASDRAAAHYRDGVDCMLSAWHGAEDAFDQAIRTDEGFALAHIARARVHQLNMQGTEARAMATRARQLAAATSPRERQHVEIMAAVIESKPKLAVTAAEAHLDEYPRDALVLSMLLGAFGLYAFSGRPDHDAAKLAVCERVAGHYGEDWWFTSYLGWSHTEAGNLGTGRALSERAMALRPANANAAHGLSHAMFEQGDMAEGRKFLAQWLPAHDRKSFLHGHLWWHTALSALDEDDLDTALAIYEQQIKPAGRPYPPLNIFTDGASLLWRLALDGCDIPRADWDEIVDYGDRRAPVAGGHFIDLHYVLAAAMGDLARFDKRVSELEALDANGRLSPGNVAVAMCKGAHAIAVGDKVQGTLEKNPNGKTEAVTVKVKIEQNKKSKHPPCPSDWPLRPIKTLLGGTCPAQSSWFISSTGLRIAIIRIVFGLFRRLHYL